MTQTTRQQIERAMNVINKAIAVRKSYGFPLLVNELIAEVAEARELDADMLSDYYYGILEF